MNIEVVRKKFRAKNNLHAKKKEKKCFVVVHMRYTLQKGIQLQFFIWSNRKPLFGGKSRFPLIIDTNYGWKDIASNTHIKEDFIFNSRQKNASFVFHCTWNCIGNGYSFEN